MSQLIARLFAAGRPSALGAGEPVFHAGLPVRTVFLVLKGRAAILARAAQSARLRAEIRSLPRVVDRLDVWLAEGNTLPDRGQWQTVAAELGITREALYRELARRRPVTP